MTPDPYELVQWRGQSIRVETCAKIIAKKMWHRGDRAKARDLYDLCAVAEADPSAIERAGPWFRRHGAQFLAALANRADIARLEFAQIDAIGAARDFDRSLAQARLLIEPLL